MVPRKGWGGIVLAILNEMGGIPEQSAIIRMLRGLSGLSKQKFCKKSGISRSTLDRLESGQSKMSKPTREKLAKVFGSHFLEITDPGKGQ